MGNQPPRPHSSPASHTPASRWSEDRQWWYDWQEKRWRPAAEWQGAPPPPQASHMRHPVWPWVLGGLAALVVLMGVCVAVFSSVGLKQTNAGSTATQPTAAAQKATASPARIGGCGPQPCANDNYGWIVAVSDVKYDVPSGNQFEKPEAGNVFVTVNVTFTNRLEQEQHADPFQFVLLDGAGIKHATAFLGPCESWQAVNVTKGATFGPKCLAFQATAGKPNGLVLVWTPTVLGGGFQMKLT